MIEFDYRYEKGAYYPIVELVLEYKGNKIKTDAIVDSGASISIFKSDIAKAIGISIKNGEKRIFQAASAKLIGYIHNVIISINDHKINSKVAFSDDLQTSFNLLGRETVFERFIITFNEKNKKILFNPI